ncbi:reverse transcriptase domain-containing protein [uncultured Thiodictyon sp.]|jgi:hypothetical protein|uniref:reverse transcriptase domain-containing protein n=1 Tax=uncultured Thiodictyon sp. TaxID=1846217 RepID=UPI0025F1A918|nr:reverse transcriptase domain-containing protein [uncultured Thiodictyon sp.]
MKTLPRGLFDALAAPDALWLAYRAVRTGKRRGPAMAADELDADRDIMALSRELLAGLYRPRPWGLRLIHDSKPRLIAAPAVRDRIVHRSLLGAIGPHFERRYLATHFTRGPGTGVHQAILAFLAANRRFAFRLHLDIRRYFPSIDHETLERLLFRELRDRRVRWLIRQILRSGESVYRSELARVALGPGVLPLPPRTGLPLGSWFSQWAGAFYLDGLDQFVKRELKLPGYLRYMDDFVLFAESAERLTAARAAVADWGLDHNSARLVSSRGRRPVAEHGLARANPHRRAGLGRIYDQGRRLARRGARFDPEPAPRPDRGGGTAGGVPRLPGESGGPGSEPRAAPTPALTHPDGGAPGV